MGGLHHVMLVVEDDEDPGPMTEPPWAFCRIDVIAGVATLSLIPLSENGDEMPATAQFSVSAASLVHGVTALIADEESGDPQEWEQRRRHWFGANQAARSAPTADVDEPAGGGTVHPAAEAGEGGEHDGF